jgi:hypothetical protein
VKRSMMSYIGLMHAFKQQCHPSRLIRQKQCEK